MDASALDGSPSGYIKIKHRVAYSSRVESNKTPRPWKTNTARSANRLGCNSFYGCVLIQVLFGRVRMDFRAILVGLVWVFSEASSNRFLGIPLTSH